MPWLLRSSRHILAAVLACALVAGIGVAAVPAPEPPHASFVLANVGGGSGGTSGSSIWTAAWWEGSPQGPGPYMGSPGGGVDLCIWHDLGPSLGDFISGLGEASLPASFWQTADSGGHTQFWGIEKWAESELRTSSGSDHFDLVACPMADQVPGSAVDIENDFPEVTPPHGPPLYLWAFWDTVQTPPAGGHSGIVQEALASADLPTPEIYTSPQQVNGTGDATVVNLPTWLWIDGKIWHEHSAQAVAGDEYAEVWATPQSVAWKAKWDYSSPQQDPEGGTTFGPEILDQVCDGPGTVYQLTGPNNQTSDCSFDFTQSSFGRTETLSAFVTWKVYWAVTNQAGIVGAEGALHPVVTVGRRPLHVLQVESVITSG